MSIWIQFYKQCWNHNEQVVLRVDEIKRPSCGSVIWQSNDFFGLVKPVSSPVSILALFFFNVPLSSLYSFLVVRRRALDRMSPLWPQSKCTLLIIRTEDLNACPLAHELCSKIEVTAKRELSPRSSPRHSSDSFFSLLCRLSSPLSLYLLLRSRRFCSLPLLIREGDSPCFCFDNIFSLRIGRESSSSASRLLLPPSISFFDPVRSARKIPAESSPRDFVDYNKCVCSSRRYRPVALLLFFLLLLFSLIILLCCHRWLPIRLFGKTTTTMAWSNSIQQAMFCFESTRFSRIKHDENLPQ